MVASTAFKGLLGIAGAVALAAYIARPRFPETASNRGFKTAIGLGSKCIRLIQDVGGLMGYSPLNISRALIAASPNPLIPNENVEIYTTTMDGVEVMVFKPAGGSNKLRPGIVYIHGGGWVIFTPTDYTSVCHEIVLQTQSVVVSVNYRKAPEHKYPVPLEDCLTATRHFLTNAEQYGVDKDNIGVQGDSAGGNLAMAVSLKLSKEIGLPKLKFMALYYPALQAFDFNIPCYRKYDNGPGFLTKRIMIEYWLYYGFGNLDLYNFFNENSHLLKYSVDSKYAMRVNPKFLPKEMQNEPVAITKKEQVTSSIPIQEEVSSRVIDPLFSPLMASDEDLKLLPRTYVFNAEFDVLRDDGFILVGRMQKLGLDVTHSYMPTEEHGFLNFFHQYPTVTEEMGKFANFFNETVDRK